MSESLSSRRPSHRVVATFLAAALLSLLALYQLAGSTGAGLVRAQGDDALSGVTVQSASRSPAARTRYEVEFVTPRALSSLTDRIVMTLHQDIRIPSFIATDNVRVQYRKEEEAGSGDAGDVSIIQQGSSKDPAILTLYHAVEGDGGPVEIPAGAKVTITFLQEARIHNPTEGGSFDWTVHTDRSPRPVMANHPDPEVRDAFRQASLDNRDTGLLVDREVRLTPGQTGRGQRVVVSARGYREDRTVYVWRDANTDGRQDSGEIDLCQAVVASNGRGTCSFVVGVPPFSPGFGSCEGEDSRNCNFINATDGVTGSTVVDPELSDFLDAGQVLELVGRIDAEQFRSPHGGIFIEVIDFPPGRVTSVAIGGMEAEIGQLAVGTSGRLQFVLPLPNGVRLGRQYLAVKLDRSDTGEEFSQGVIVAITRLNTEVIIFPQTALPNQRIHLRGAGFTRRMKATIREVRVGSLAVRPERISGGEGMIEMAGDGRWSASLDLPVNEETTSPGVKTLKLIDTGGRLGLVEFTIPPREITVTPEWGRPGTLVTVAGKGFPARNDSVSSVPIRLYYESAAGYSVTSVETDLKGNFSQEIRIPLETPSPSSNAVRVEFDNDKGTRVFTRTVHQVPGATVEISPAAGPPGTRVMMTGRGFRNHAQVNSVRIGVTDVTPGPPISTDGHGAFFLTFQAPGIGAGRQTVSVSVAGLTASATFDLWPSGVSAGSRTSVTEGLADLGGALVRLWHFDNNAKAWSYYDPLMAGDGPLTHLVAGEAYLLLVRQTLETVLNGKARHFTCYQGNCWNQIVW